MIALNALVSISIYHNKLKLKTVTIFEYIIEITEIIGIVALLFIC